MKVPLESCKLFVNFAHFNLQTFRLLLKCQCNENLGRVPGQAAERAQHEGGERDELPELPSRADPLDRH